MMRVGWVAGGWVALAAGALLNAERAGAWLAALTLVLGAAGLAWGWRRAVQVGLANGALSVAPVALGYGPAWLAGPWTAWAMLVVLLRARERDFFGRAQELAAKERELREGVGERLRAKEEILARIQERERGTQEISELYELSKRFLATLDLEEGLAIASQALERWIPLAREEERREYLRRIREVVERGEVSLERLIQWMPMGGTDFAARDRWGMVCGQLALGLQRIALYRKVQESATHDGLTGLLVRRSFGEHLAEEVDRTVRRSSRLAFLMVDLDRFKQVNDAHGHLVGDVVLREVAQRIRGSVREMDLVGRYGGEEFGVVLPEAGRDLAVEIGDRIRHAVGGLPIRAYDDEVRMTVSVGVAVCPEDGASAEALVERADRALYRAKAIGRDRTVAG